MMLVAFAMGTWIGTHMTDPLQAMAQGLMLWSVCLVLIGSLAVRRIPLPRLAPPAPPASPAPKSPTP